MIVATVGSRPEAVKNTYSWRVSFANATNPFCQKGHSCEDRLGNRQERPMIYVLILNLTANRQNIPPATEDLFRPLKSAHRENRIELAARASVRPTLTSRKRGD